MYDNIEWRINICEVNCHCAVYENIPSQSSRGHVYYCMHSCGSVGDPRTQLSLFRHGKLGANQASLPRQAGVAEGAGARV